MSDEDSGTQQDGQTDGQQNDGGTKDGQASQNGQKTATEIIDGQQKTVLTDGAKGGQKDGQTDGKGDKQVAEWRAGIVDPELRKQAERYPGLDDVLKHNGSMRQQLSTAIVIPGEDASDEDRAEYRTKLGVPEGADKYVYKAPEDLAEDIAKMIPDDEMAAIRATAHDLGLTQAQLSGLMDWRYEQLTAAVEAQVATLKAAHDTATADMKREWAADYDQNVALGKRAMREFGSDGLDKFLTETVIAGVRLGDHPEIVRLAATVGRRMMEAQVHMEHGSDERKTLEEQREQLTKDMHDARAAGDNDKARRLDAERSEVTNQLYGNGAIVGEEGRTV